jgi:hypothetical protein
MPRAAFEDEPQASAAGSALRDLGFSVEITTSAGNDSFEERARGFLAGKVPSFEVHAMLASDDADVDAFARIVQRHHGIIIL